jgi:hypothetical protein
MSKDQLDALEQWIVAIIKDEGRHSDLIDRKQRDVWREQVEKEFGI